MVQLRWRKPSAPSRASVFAISSPTTVSMFAPTMGSDSDTPGKSGIVRSTFLRELTGVCCGRNRKSSNVRPTKRGSSSFTKSLWHG
jgi:hypothetical protein